MLGKQQSSGVSPVIGIILMVAVTVGLVALASTIVFDLGSNVNEPADVSGNLQFDAASSEVVAEVIRNENAQSVSVRYTAADDSDKERVVADGAGVTGTEVLSKSDLCNGSTNSGQSGTVELVANVGETDNQQIIDTADWNIDCP